MKNIRVAVLLLLIMAMGSTEALALRDDPGPPGRRNMENVRERVGTIRMWKMTKALDLDTKTSAELFPIMNRYDKKRAGLELSLREDMRDLRAAVRDGRPGSLRALIDRIEQNHQALQRLNDEEWQESKRVLTVEQQAKYLLFRQEFERDMRMMIDRVRDRRQDRQGMHRPSPAPAG